MKKRKIIFDEKFFNLLQFCARAFCIPLGGIVLSAGNLIFICIRDNLPQVLPYSIGMTLLGFAGTMIAVYLGFFIEYEEKKL